MKILRPSSIETTTSYYLDFNFVGSEGSGYGFECDADGKVKEEVGTVAHDNYLACLTGEVNGRKIRPSPFVRKYEKSWRRPKVGECNHCGAEVVLSNFTNTCDCGADYNYAGQELARRSQWGEETGEHWSDCY